MSICLTSGPSNTSQGETATRFEGHFVMWQIVNVSFLRSSEIFKCGIIPMDKSMRKLLYICMPIIQIDEIN